MDSSASHSRSRPHCVRAWVGGLALMLAAGAALAQADATIDQVYQAARSGHVAQAQQMMAAVLRDHPNSGKAHYVEAELLARQGQIQKAREELQTAQQLAPGLPFARADAVQALQRELSPAPGGHFGTAPGGGHWGVAVALLAGALLAWLLTRLGRPQAVAAAAPPPAAAPASWPGTGFGPVAPAGPPASAPGLGGQIAGGLATGLAVGAGMVAAETLAHRLLDGGPAIGAGLPRPERMEPLPDRPLADPDMGGADFGINDDTSWDDGGAAASGDWDT